MIATDLAATIGATIPIAISGGFLGVILGHRSQNRLNRASTRKADADAAKTEQDFYQELRDDLLANNDELRDRIDRMQGEMSSLRDDARDAAASAKEAQADAAKFRALAAESDARLAEVQAELARTIASASVERHNLQNDIKALTTKLEAREMEIAELREEFETLLARLGHKERRSPDGLDRRGD